MFNHFYEKKDQHRCTLYIGEALGRPKDPGAASGRLKILYDYIYTKIQQSPSRFRMATPGHRVAGL